MRNIVWLVAVILIGAQSWARGQSPKAATYITAEQIKQVNTRPGDRQLVTVDIGKLNEAIGILHRGAMSRAAAAAPRPSVPPAEACGARGGSAPTGEAQGLSHDFVTETYVIVSGGGTLVTGGHIVNGRVSAADSDVSRILVGKSCSGLIAGSDVVKREVTTGDVVIIPAGVPHGWAEIPDHVHYLSVRADPDRVLQLYTNPGIK